MTRVKSAPRTRTQRSKAQRSRIAPRAARRLGDKERVLLFSLLLAAATIALYIPALGHGFLVFDDSDYITTNYHLHGGLRWSTIEWAFTANRAANWHPLTWLSHALDYQLFGLNATGHHFVSILIHAINAVLLFLILNWMTRRVGPSLLVAALFAVHPVNAESVAWVAERKNVLSMLFFLLAIAAYVKYARKPDWKRYLLVAALFAAGLMAKPMVITLPFVLLLLDYWPLDRVAFHHSPFAVRRQELREVSGEQRIANGEWRALLWEKVPLLLLSAASAVVTLKVQRSGYAVRTLVEFPLAVRIENALVAYVLYLRNMIWPTRLALYPHLAIAPPAWQWILSALLLATITAAVIVFRRKRYLPVGWFWFLGTLVPVIGLVQVGEGAMADRYAYLPLIGIFIVIAFGLSDLSRAKQLSLASQVVPALCVLAGLSALTYRQMSYWASDYTLWAHTLAVTENPFAHDAIGSALLDPNMVIASGDNDLNTAEKRMNAARAHFQRALEMRRELAPQNPAAYVPDMATTLNNLGNLDRLERKPERARADYTQALQLQQQVRQQKLQVFPADEAVTLNNLGALERDSGQLDAAAHHFADALAIYRRVAQSDPDGYEPKIAETLNNLALVARQQKSLDEARQHYEEALQIQRQLVREDPDRYLPFLAKTLNDLGILDAVQQRDDDARHHYEEALSIYRGLVRADTQTYLPFLAATLNNLALLDEGQNHFADARAHFEEALELFQQLYHDSPVRYRADVARVQTSLEELKGKAAQ